VLVDFRVYLNTFLLKSYIHYKLNMLGLILTTTLTSDRDKNEVILSVVSFCVKPELLTSNYSH